MSYNFNCCVFSNNNNNNNNILNMTRGKSWLKGIKEKKFLMKGKIKVTKENFQQYRIYNTYRIQYREYTPWGNIGRVTPSTTTRKSPLKKELNVMKSYFLK